MKKPNIFVLAAGFGERLMPITSHIPKPLLPILGKSILERVLEKVSAVPHNEIGINIHYKWEMISDWIHTSQYSSKIIIFHEPAKLGTGGALKNAGIFLQNSTFIVHNSDILSDINLNDLIELHKLSGNSATLAVHSRDEFSNVWIDDNNAVKFVGDISPEKQKGLRRVAFTGIAAYSSPFLDFLPAGPSSVVDAWMRASDAGQQVGTVDFTGCSWSDIGTPEAYSAAVFQALKKDGESVYIYPSVACSDINFGSYTVIEKGSIVTGHAFLRNCILLPGSRVAEDSFIENAIVGPDLIINVDEPLSRHPLLPLELTSKLFNNTVAQLYISSIGTGGSDRSYFRIKDKDKSYVFMECSCNDRDFERQLLYSHFFKKYLVPVPDLIGRDACDSRNMLNDNKLSGHAIFEDLGDLSLYSWLKCRREPKRIEALYRRVLDILITLHTTATTHVSECPQLQSRLFDYEHLSWETAYFIDRFVCGLMELDIGDRGLLNEDFSRLARQVDAFRKTIVHRDFQSQNVMVTEGDIPRLIDYQGARIGPPAYDLASILWDPYFALDPAMRERLNDYYTEGIKDFFRDEFDIEEFRRTIIPCRLQRHMQALGAYGFLSKVKGKSYFLKHIPQALLYLKEEIEMVKTEYPSLYELIQRIK